MSKRQIYKPDVQITQVRNGYITKRINATNEKDIYVFPSIASMMDHIMHHFEGGELTQDLADELNKEVK